MNGAISSNQSNMEVGSELCSMDQMNNYADIKNYAKSFVDIALLTANANQLRYIYSTDINDVTRTPALVLVSMSILFQVFFRQKTWESFVKSKANWKRDLFQVIAGLLLIFDHVIKVKSTKDYQKCTCLTTTIAILMFLIIVINIFLLSFTRPDKYWIFTGILLNIHIDFIIRLKMVAFFYRISRKLSVLLERHNLNFPPQNLRQIFKTKIFSFW